MNERIKDAMKNIASYAIILLVSVAYVATAFLSLERSGKSLWQIAVDGIMVFIVGVLINRAFEIRGILEGEQDEELKQEELLHERQVDGIAPLLDELEKWCDKKNREALRIQRTRILIEKGLKYSDYFDEDGLSLPLKVDEELLKKPYLGKIERTRIKCYIKALRLELTPLSAAVLTGESGRGWDPYFLGRSKAEYTKESGRGDVIIKILMAIAFGYFGVSLIRDWSLANLIWKIFQISVFLCMGNQKRLKSCQFVQGEFKGRMNKKRKYLQMFEQSRKKEEVDHEHNGAK